jgi:hypothetical protein
LARSEAGDGWRWPGRPLVAEPWSRVCTSTWSATVATNRERRAAEHCRIQLATAVAAGHGGSRSSSKMRWQRIVVANDGGGDRGCAFVRGREDFVFLERGREKRDEVIGPGVGLDTNPSWAGLWPCTQQPCRHLRSPRPRWVSVFDFLYLLFLLFSFLFLSFILSSYYLFIFISLLCFHHRKMCSCSCGKCSNKIYV